VYVYVKYRIYVHVDVSVEKLKGVLCNTTTCTGTTGAIYMHVCICDTTECVVVERETYAGLGRELVSVLQFDNITRLVT
jgi:hypothetical protein